MARTGSDPRFNPAADGRALVFLAITMLMLGTLAAPAASQSYAHEARLTAGMAWDQFGFSVAIHGDTAVAGAIKTDDYKTGEVHVFVRQDGVWRQRARLGSVGVGLGFGISVAIHGDTIVVGKIDYYWDHGPGSAHVYVRNGSTWTHQAKLVAPDGAADDYFGNSVAISGNTIVVGAPWDDSAKHADRGSAHVFVRNGGTWTWQAMLAPAGGGSGDNFGRSVAISGHTVIVGAPNTGNGGPGAAYVFARNGSSWSQEAGITASDAKSAAWFGQSVALSAAADRVVVGAPFAKTDASAQGGAAYLFARSGAVWTQQGKLTASDGNDIDLFGVSVAIDGNAVVVGAPWHDLFGQTNHGAAYVFTCGGSCVEAQKLFAAGAAHDNFGYALAIDRTGTGTIIAGVPLADVWPWYGPRQVNQGAVELFSVPR